MSLSTDALLERIRLKSQIVKWRGVAILFAALAAFLWYGKGIDFFPGRNYIAMITIDGLVQEDYERDKNILALADDGDVKAVIVHINTPGGTVVGGETLYKVLREVNTKKPVVSVMGTLATSAGYMTALGTEHIIANRGSLTGSIGVILHTAEVLELAKKVGVDIEVIKSGPLKASPSPFEKMTPEARKVMEDVIEDYHNVFIDMVVESRKLLRQEVVKLADGRVYTGGQALENKLVDGLGGVKEAVAWLQENKGLSTDNVEEVNIYKQQESLKDMLTSMATGGRKSLLPQLLSLQGLLSVWVDGIMLN